MATKIVGPCCLDTLLYMFCTEIQCPTPMYVYIHLVMLELCTNIFRRFQIRTSPLFLFLIYLYQIPLFLFSQLHQANAIIVIVIPILLLLSGFQLHFHFHLRLRLTEYIKFESS